MEFINLAVPGYGVDQQYWTLQERGWDYEPDLIIHCMVMNDLFECLLNEHYSMPKPRFTKLADGEWGVERPKGMAKANSFKNRARQAYRNLRANSALIQFLAPQPFDKIAETDSTEVPFPMPSVEQFFEVQKVAQMAQNPNSPSYHAKGELARACQARDVPLLVFNFPHQHDRYLYEPRFPRPPWVQVPKYQGPLSQAAEALGKIFGFHTVDMDHALLERTNAGDRLHIGDGHPNRAGHKLIAEQLTPMVRELLDLSD